MHRNRKTKSANFEHLIEKQATNEPDACDFSSDIFMVLLDSRLTASVANQMNNHGCELVSLAIGRPEDYRSPEEDKHKIMPIYIQEYVDVYKAAAAAIAAQDTEEKAAKHDDDVCWETSLVNRELVAHNLVEEYGYVLAADLLSAYGWPVISIAGEAPRCKHHVLVIFERQPSDGLLSFAVEAVNPQELQELE